MKRSIVSAVSIVLVSIFFCPMLMAAPPMPADLQMVQPDPSLPKELAAFFGKWEGTADISGRGIEFFVIVESVDKEKASLYIYRTDLGWVRYEATVSKERGKYKLSFRGREGWCELTMKEEYLDLYIPPRATARLRRVP